METTSHFPKPNDNWQFSVKTVTPQGFSNILAIENFNSKSNTTIFALKFRGELPTSRQIF